MLQVHALSKSFGTHRALDDVSFEVAPGRMTGFVGANGAGKTTTMRVMLGLISADSGQVTIDGRPVTAADRRTFGYMPEERGLYPKMRVREQLVYLARLHGLTASRASANADSLIDRLGLGERRGDPIQNLSLGNQQRAQVAASLVHEPSSLVLDEPFSGLDPMAVETVLAVLREQAAAGVPVLFSSHQLDVVERLCDDLVIIADGRIRAAGSGDDLRREHASNRYEIVVAHDAGWIRDEEGIRVLEFARGHALFDAASDEDAQRVLRTALARGAVTRFAPQHPTLSQIFREVVS